MASSVTPKRIAWFSPLPCDGGSTESPASYLTTKLLPELEKNYQITLFHDQVTEFEGRKVNHFLTAYSLHRENPFDVFVYNLEDSKESYFCRAHLALIPGIVIFHHFTLSNYGPEPLLNSPWQAVMNLVESSNKIDWFCSEGEFPQSGPQAFREASWAAVRVFCNERDHREYRRLAFGGGVEPHSERSYYLPYPADCVQGQKKEKTQSMLRIAMCGGPRIEDRAHKILSAVSKLGEKVSCTWLVSESELNEATILVDELDCKSVRIMTGRNPTSWQKLLTESDLALHLHFSVFGHLGPYLAISTSMGVPSVITNFGEGEVLPGNIFFKINPGVSEERELYTLLESLKLQSLNELSARVKSYGTEISDFRKVAGEFKVLLSESFERQQRALQKMDLIKVSARQQLLEDLNNIQSKNDLEFSLNRSEVFKELNWITTGASNA